MQIWLVERSLVDSVNLLNDCAVNTQEPEAMKNSHSFKIQNLGTLHNEQSSRYSWLPWLKNKV